MISKVQKIIELLTENNIEIDIENDDLILFNNQAVYPDHIISEVEKNKKELIIFLSLLKRTKKVDKQAASSISEISQKETSIIDTLKLQERRYIRYKIGAYTPLNLTVLHVKLEDVNQEVLSKCINALVERHEGLRTLFQFKNGKVMQKIYNTDKFNSNLLFQDISASKNKEELLKSLVDEVVTHLFDFETEQAFKFKLIKYSEHEYELIFVIDHIIGDDSSMQILKEELSQLYNAFDKNLPNPLNPIRFGIKDFVADFHQHYEGDYLKKHRAYYNGLFRDQPQRLKIKPKYSGIASGLEREKLLEDSENQLTIPGEFAKYNLSPTAYQRLTENSNGSVYLFTIPEEVLKNAQDLATELQTSLYAVFIAVYGIFFNEITEENEFVIDSPVALRSNQDFLSLVGWLVGSMMVPVTVNENDLLKDLILSGKNKIVEAMQHSHFQPEIKFVELLQSKLNFIYDDGRDMPLIENTPQYTTNVYYDFSFIITVFQNGMGVACEYNKSIIEESKIKGICDKFIDILKRAGNSKQGNVKIADLSN